ncbi:MAG: SGNH/GDSL hydrolase family protein [Gammaproteobacteria bacterium]
MLAAGTVILTLAITLLLIRGLAPALLNIPVDLQMVQTSKSVPPFFDGIFREADYATDAMLLKDPYLNVRFKPLLPGNGTSGPHDILGFRNAGIPNTVDIVAIGDSQTYGLGVAFEDNWPSQLTGQLGHKQLGVYSMAVGGWAAIQYLDIFAKAALLKPTVVIVAFYSGNDSLESFAMAYGTSYWAGLRVNPALQGSDAPEVTPLLSMKHLWPVTFSDGTEVVFTPRARLDINDSDHPAVHAGFDIMAEAARRIGALARSRDIVVVFTVIPTRELAYARKVSRDRLGAPESYRRLIVMEAGNIERLAVEIRAIPGARYLDLVAPLQAAALAGEPLYPRKWDGHPGRAGYQIIAATLATELDVLFP